MPPPSVIVLPSGAWQDLASLGAHVTWPVAAAEPVAGFPVGAPRGAMCPEAAATGPVATVAAPVTPSVAAPQKSVAAPQKSVAAPQKIVISIAPDSKNNYNFTFVNAASAAYNNAPEVIEVGEEEKEKRIPPVNVDPEVQLDIARLASDAFNVTYVSPPPTSCLPSPQVLQFILERDKGNVSHAGMLDVVTRLHERLEVLESSTSMNRAKKRHREDESEHLPDRTAPS
jgi:hypothetical protein